MFIATRIYYISKLNLEHYHLANVLQTVKNEQESVLRKYNKSNEDSFLLNDNFSQEEKIRLLQSIEFSKNNKNEDDEI
jgi:hypothetical protein